MTHKQSLVLRQARANLKRKEVARPNTEERRACWRGEPPLLDEVAHRRVEYVNKELTDDLCGRVTVVVGRLRARTLFRNLL